MRTPIVVEMHFRTRLAIVVLLATALALLCRPFVRPNAECDERESRDFAAADVWDKRAETAAKTETECRMSECFDFGRCLGVQSGLRVHVYGADGRKVSPSFDKILESLRSSKYAEKDPQKACLFVFSDWDSVDRDPLSPDFQKAPPSAPPLHSGRNHLLFNLYSGSWPQYRELDFQNADPHLVRNAIRVKTSQSRATYRHDFDVSFPLFARNHPLRGPAHRDDAVNAPVSASVRSSASGLGEKYLLVFKGKRYTSGIGSETRNALHLLHNGRDVIVLTTCRHGKKYLKDDKCDDDDKAYDSHDYQSLMKNATFCLIPRGRRLASYRFLEALQFGCLPVVLADEWLLPFHEIIDWTQCAVAADERLLLQTPETLRQISRQKVVKMRAKCLALYETYFSSVEKIVMTSLLVVEQRLLLHASRHHFLASLSNPSDQTAVALLQSGVRDAELFQMLTKAPDFRSGFTAVVHVTEARDVTPALQRLVQRTLRSTRHVTQTVVLWPSTLPLPPYLVQRHDARVLRFQNQSIDWRFDPRLLPASQIPTDALLFLSPLSSLSAQELDFAFQVWTAFPDRVVGFSSRDHFWSNERTAFEYSSKWTNRYSSLLLDAAFHHKALRHAHHLYFDGKQVPLECQDLAFAFLVSHVTRQGPLKVTQRKRATNGTADAFETWHARRLCFDGLSLSFGYLPLIRSRVRFDPLLFKDAVARRRKKYAKLEL